MKMTKTEKAKIGRAGNRIMFFCNDVERVKKGFGKEYIYNGAVGELKGYSAHMCRVHFDEAPAGRIDPISPEYVVAGFPEEQGKEISEELADLLT